MSKRKLYIAMGPMSLIVQIVMARPGDGVMTILGLTAIGWIVSIAAWEGIEWLTRD